jgi:hypothetical protein
MAEVDSTDKTGKAGKTVGIGPFEKAGEAGFADFLNISTPKHLHLPSTS